MKNSKELIFIGIGSNMGTSLANCLDAIEKIEAIKGIDIVNRSSLYRSAPVGFTEQGWFVNCVIGIKTAIEPHCLLKELLAIEDSMGRVRKKKWDERVIDLDIILYGNQIIEDEELTIPHPLMHERSFVLIPLNEIAPSITHPILDISISSMADMVRRQEVYKIE